MDTDGITKIATEAADLIYEMSQPMIESGMNLRLGDVLFKFRLHSCVLLLKK